MIKILCRISDEIYGVNPPSYETIIQIDRSVREFEKNIPLPLRCRAASLGRNLHNYEVKEDGNIDEKFVLQVSVYIISQFCFTNNTLIATFTCA